MQEKLKQKETKTEDKSPIQDFEWTWIKLVAIFNLAVYFSTFFKERSGNSL